MPPEADDYLLYSTRVPRTIVALVKHLEEQNMSWSVWKLPPLARGKKTSSS